ncbi:MAG: D-glycero-alpha-D-manno-heptose-1,7-bisphosphate 7-phosphatase [Promethearchaeota archaeon]
MKAALFLDRDGTINEDIGYDFSIDKLKILPGVIEGLRMLGKYYEFFIITNQAGIGYGYYTLDTFKRFNEAVLEKLNENDIKIVKTYYCPHVPNENCDCRKPKTKFIKEAEKNFGIDLKNSWMIGDHPSDILLGINAGFKTVYVLTGHGIEHINDLEERRIKPTIIANDFLAAANEILKIEKKKG